MTVQYTFNDMFPDLYVEYNCISTVIDAVIAGQRILFLGDLQSEGGARVAELYEEDNKCDVMQIAHHGIGGGTLELYQYCDPDIAFWPAGRQIIERYYIFSSTPQNIWIRDNADVIYYHCNGTVTLWFEDIPDSSGVSGTIDSGGRYSKLY